jgi:hypothetical protein
LPRTGSTAISKELCSQYGGEKILKKHATYSDFLRVASDDEKQYFVFSSIRNPMDKILSLYFKYKTNQRGYENKAIYRGGNFLIAWLMQTQFRFVQNTNASFVEFFKRFYRLPYDDWSSLDHEKLDYVLHFERLSEDFDEVLRRIGVESARSLPVTNKTAERDAEFWSYYTPEIHARARWVFRPYFNRWGYEFPAGWSAVHYRTNEFVFAAANIFRNIYWRHIR